jgi:hypothetical protein
MLRRGARVCRIVSRYYIVAFLVCVGVCRYLGFMPGERLRIGRPRSGVVESSPSSSWCFHGRSRMRLGGETRESPQIRSILQVLILRERSLMAVVEAGRGGFCWDLLACWFEGFAGDWREAMMAQVGRGSGGGGSGALGPGCDELGVDPQPMVFRILISSALCGLPMRLLKPVWAIWLRRVPCRCSPAVSGGVAGCSLASGFFVMFVFLEGLSAKFLGRGVSRSFELAPAGVRCNVLSL